MSLVFYLFISHGKLATAVLLVIEVKFFQQLIPPFIKAALAPVLRPERRLRHRRLCQMTCTLNLFQTLPSAGGQCRGEIADTECLGLLRRGRQPQQETLFAASSSLRLSLQSAHILSPLLVIIVAIDPGQTQPLRMTFTLLFADLVLLPGPDIRIVIEYRWMDLMLQVSSSLL